MTLETDFLALYLCPCWVQLWQLERALQSPGHFTVLRLNECSWCSHLQECQPKHANPDLCRNSHPLHSDGVWWAKNVRKIANFSKCQTNDFVPGITLLKYYSPPNFSYPDEVIISNVSKASVQPIYLQGELNF